MHPTRSYERPSAEARFRVLPHDTTVEECRRLARSAALAFVAGTANGWTKQELRRWMLLEYEGATVHSCVGQRYSHDEPTEGLTDLDVGLAIEDVRQRLLRMIESARTLWHTPTFPRDMIDSRYVMVVYDRTGAQGFAPAAHKDMRLIDRVLSLFVADFLNAPGDYDYVSACSTCGEIAIGATHRHAMWCSERHTRPPRSGIMTRPPADGNDNDRPMPSRTFALGAEIPADKETLRGVG